MRERDVWTLLAVLLMTGSALCLLGPGERAMVDPYDSDADPGDETPHPHPPVRYDPDQVAILPRHIPCPRCSAVNEAARQTGSLDRVNSAASVRWRDGALWCKRCSLAFYPMTPDEALETLTRAAA